MLLIHPPVVRPCEPPPGLAKLAGALKRRHVDCAVIDANLEGLLYLLARPVTAQDTWTRRAVSRMAGNIEAMRRPDAYENIDRYTQCVSELNRVLASQGNGSGIRVSLSNYQDSHRSPVNSRDLISAYESPAVNPFFPYYEKRFAPVMENGSYQVVGISINFLAQALCAFALMGVIKRNHPKTRILVGGGMITSWLRRPGWENPFSGIIDRLVAGPGEDALLSELGLAPLEAASLPDYELFPRSRYLSPGLVLPYSTSSGCYWRRCAFCPEKAEQNPYQPIATTQVANQLHTLVAQYRPAMLHLTDNALSPALLHTLTVQSPGAPWYGFVRITPDLADPEFCRALKRCGCVMLQIGLESGSQRVLDAFGKGIDLEIAEKALHALTQAGIATYIYLLFGTPWENETDAEKTFEFTVTHRDAISFLNLAVFNLPAYGQDADWLDTTPFYTGDLFLYRSFKHPKGWDRSAVRQFLDKRFKRHPAVAAIIRRDPPVFTSNHAPFFV